MIQVGIKNKIGLKNKKISGSETVNAPTSLAVTFNVNTISADLTWTNNAGASAVFEIYSNTNVAGAVLVATTAAGATSYSDTTCKQNASVIYSIRAKKGSKYSEYATASAIITPLCFKTNQSTLTTLTLNVLNITATKTVHIDWGDGTSNDYTGSASRTKNYSATGIYNVSISGDVNFITRLEHNTQPTSYGNLANWILPSACTRLSLSGCSFTGDLSAWVIPSTMTVLFLYSNGFTGKIPNLSIGAGGMDFRMYSNSLTGTNTTVFRAGMTVFNVKTQNVAFPTAETDKLYKAAADYYQVTAPTANCTYDTSGANMGQPTGGALNADIVRLKGYYTAAGFAATVTL